MRSLTIATFGASAVSRCGEIASRQQRNPHGGEIARFNLRRAGKESRLRLTLDVEVALDEHHAERRRVDQARGLHAWKILDAIEHAARERLGALGRVGEAFGQRHLDGLHDAVAPARFEAGRDRRETHEAVNQQAGADQKDERHRDLRGDQQRPQPLALTVARRARFAGVQREAFAKRGPADAQRRHEADEQRRDERQAEAERHHACVNHDAAEPWQCELRDERQRDADRELREHHAERRAEQRQYDRFRQQLTHDPPAFRAEGHAHRQFAAPRGEARHLQVRDVDAGDQEHERHRRDQDQQQRAHRLRAVLLQADGARERAGVRDEGAGWRQCASRHDRRTRSRAPSAPLPRVPASRLAAMRPSRNRNALLPVSPGQRLGRKMSTSGSAPIRITGLKLKSGASTPTMVRGRPSMVMDCPTIAGSALSDVRQSRSLTIALRSSSGAAAPVRNARPRAGLTPSVSKKFGLTASAGTCRGSPRPVSSASIEL